MKTERREKTQTIYEEVFIANDGEEFKNRDECAKYEKTAFAVMNAKYRQTLIKERTSCCGLFDVGSDEDYIDLAEVKTQADIDILMQMRFFHNDYLRDGEEYHKKQVEKEFALLKDAMDNKKIVLIGRGYEYDCFWFIGTNVSFIEDFNRKIDRFCNPEPEEKSE